MGSGGNPAHAAGQALNRPKLAAGWLIKIQEEKVRTGAWK
jgi:hypothetical protein